MRIVKPQEVKQIAENENNKDDDDDSVLDNEELDFAIFRQLDKITIILLMKIP